MTPARGWRRTTVVACEFRVLIAASVALAALTAGCGFSPPPPPPTPTADCGPGPTPEAVTSELALLPAGDLAAISRKGSTPDCRM